MRRVGADKCRADPASNRSSGVRVYGWKGDLEIRKPTAFKSYTLRLRGHKLLRIHKLLFRRFGATGTAEGLKFLVCGVSRANNLGSRDSGIRAYF